MSIPNCEGCLEELNIAYYHQEEEGLHLATTPSRPNSYPVGRHHFALILVDDKGKVIMQ